MSMIKSLVPVEQDFSTLASGQFFIFGGVETALYQKILEMNGLGATKYNAVEFVQIASGQRGSRYEFRLRFVQDETRVSHIEVADVDIYIRPKSV